MLILDNKVKLIKYLYNVDNVKRYIAILKGRLFQSFTNRHYISKIDLTLFTLFIKEHQQKHSHYAMEKIAE